MASNPFDDFFNQPGEKKPAPETPISPLEPDPRFPESSPESLDEVLAKSAAFEQKAIGLSRLLSQTNAVDHEPGWIASSPVLRLFVNPEDPHEQGSMQREKAYHQLLCNKFRGIIEPMRELAELHLSIVKQYNNEVGEHYYSVEKTDAQVKAEREQALEAIFFQRKLLGNCARDLGILAEALEVCENRLKKYIDAGGDNNISAAEQALIAKSRLALSSGVEHNFAHRYFLLNVIDKAAISLDYYMPATSSQYLQKLESAFVNQPET
jgi:hypothetical protein